MSYIIYIIYIYIYIYIYIFSSQRVNDLNITNAQIPHERGTRLRQIGPIGLKQAPSIGLGYGLDDRETVLESRQQKRFSVPQSVQTGFGAHQASCFWYIPAALAPKVTLTAHIRLVTMFKM